MMTAFTPRAWRGPALAPQILALLLGGLVVAQLVTLLLTIILPPDPPAKYGLGDIAASLRAGSGVHNGLAREERSAAPDASGPGWLMSDSSRVDLARLLGADPADVRLSFYTPLPFAGTVAQPTRPERSADGGDHGPIPGSMPARIATISFEGMIDRPLADRLDGGPAADTPLSRMTRASSLILAQAGPGGMPGGPPMGMPGGGFPGGGFPGGPPGGFPGGPAGGGPTPTAPGAAPPPPPSSAPPPASPAPPPQANAAGAPPPLASQMVPPPVAIPSLPPGAAAGIDTSRFLDRNSLAAELPRRPDTSEPRTGDVPAAIPSHPPVSDTPKGAVEPPAVATQQTAPDVAGAPTLQHSANTIVRDAVPVPRRGLQGAIDRARGFFGLAPSPFVEGDFVAALRLADGRWIVVQPETNGFLSAWQKRVALWFIIAFGIVAPFGWLFARRLSRPLDRFADAAAQLGRDPSAAIKALDGPAEIGRAAHAFNLMQKRLRSFVDDRTAMVGAISHDLRTPLTRMRFRIEEVPDEFHDGMLQEVDEMEEMITSVLAFIRDASTPGIRERIDLRILLDDVAEDAAVIGAEVPIDGDVPAMVEVEVLGMRRVLANLVENALKYGGHARISLSVSQGEAIATVIDNGPGLPDEELEQVFQPFYRTAAARASSAPGTGLGLAVCRSIARAHGGDVRLCRGPSGFHAEVRVPLIYEATRALAA